MTISSDDGIDMSKKERAPRIVDPRDKNVQVRVTEDEHEKLMIYVREHETSAGKVIRSLLRDAKII